MVSIPERLDRLLFGRFHWLLVLTMFVATAFDNMDQIVLSYVIPAFRQEWSISAVRASLLRGIPSLVLFAGGALYALSTRDPVWDLVLWGAIGGLLGSVALDIVRLIGVKRGAFPADMPTLFGIISLGLAPALQRNMMAEMVANLAGLPEEHRRMVMAPRLPGDEVRHIDWNVTARMARLYVRQYREEHELTVRGRRSPRALSFSAMAKTPLAPTRCRPPHKPPGRKFPSMPLA